MGSNLVVNPLATIDTDESGDLISGGPVPGRGMKYLHINATTHPTLHSLFAELATIGLNNLDVAGDLTATDRDLLHEFGIVIQPDNVPTRPLFACMLDDVESDLDAPRQTIVNPTLEFQTFDLANFRTWMRDKHLSPHNPSVWVTDPVTDMRWGYWLSHEQAAIVANLNPGEPGNVSDRTLRSKLYAAAILIDGERIRKPCQLADQAQEFASKGYTVVDNVMPAAQLRAFRSYYREYVGQGFMKFGDEQVPRRFSAHGEHVASMMQWNLLKVMQKIVGSDIRPTYTHSAVYVDEATLDPHVDREACEYSFSFQLDYVPEPHDGISPWPLYLSINDLDDLNVDPTRDKAIHLANGSCLAYKGRELIHYRTALARGHRSTSLFFHYIPA